LLNAANERIIDADFDRVLADFLGSRAAEVFPWTTEGREAASGGWSVTIGDVLARADLSLDPKRWCERVARVQKEIRRLEHFPLGAVVDVVRVVGIPGEKSKMYQYVDIEATADGVAMPLPLRGWELPDRARHRASPGEIFVGKVWSSVGKWFVAGGDCSDVIVTNGFHRLRMKKGQEHRLLDVVVTLNTEAYRIQARAFATGSDGLADLSEDNLRDILIPVVTSKSTRATLKPMIEALLAGRSTVARVVNELLADYSLPNIDVPARSSHVVQV
jgi:type I restriction enzyme M protein